MPSPPHAPAARSAGRRSACGSDLLGGRKHAARPGRIDAAQPILAQVLRTIQRMSASRGRPSARIAPGPASKSAASARSRHSPAPGAAPGMAHSFRVIGPAEADGWPGRRGGTRTPGCAGRKAGDGSQTAGHGGALLQQRSRIQLPISAVGRSAGRIRRLPRIAGPWRRTPAPAAGVVGQVTQTGKEAQVGRRRSRRLIAEDARTRTVGETLGVYISAGLCSA